MNSVPVKPQPMARKYDGKIEDPIITTTVETTTVIEEDPEAKKKRLALEKELAEEKARTGSLNARNREMGEMNRELDSELQELKAQNRQLSDTQTDLEQEKHRVQQLKGLSEDKEQKVRELDSRLRDIQSQNEKLMQRIIELEREKKTIVASVEGDHKLKEENEMLDKELYKERGMAGRLDAMNKKLGSRNKDLDAKIKDLKTENRELSDTYAELERERLRVEQLDVIGQEKEIKIQEVDKKLKEVKAENESLLQRIVELEADRQNVEKVHVENVLIDNQNSELASVVRDLQAEVLHLAARNKELEKEKNNLNTKIELLSINPQPAPPTNNSAVTRTTLNDVQNVHPVFAEEIGAVRVVTDDVEPVARRCPNLACKLFLKLFYGLVHDFSVTDVDPHYITRDPDGPSEIENKVLIASMERLMRALEPAAEMLDGLYALLVWESPVITGLFITLYLYLCFTGYLLPGLMFLLGLRLFLNLLEEWKVIRPVRFFPAKAMPYLKEVKHYYSMGEKAHLMKEAAVKGQNFMVLMADIVEKFNKWKQEKTTIKLFLPIVAGFFSMLFLPLNLLLMIGAGLLGAKLFITNRIHARFPRIKRKFDTFYLLWSEMMTDFQIAHYKALDENVKTTTVTESAPSNDEVHKYYSFDYHDLCARFNLPYDDRPVRYVGFKGGQSCLHFLRGQKFKFSSPVANYAKLYLTPHHLCYELIRDAERQTIELTDITSVQKIRAISILPGGGPGLEVTVKGFDIPHIFSGLIDRDACYAELAEMGRSVLAPFAMNPIPVPPVTVVETKVADKKGKKNK